MKPVDAKKAAPRRRPVSVRTLAALDVHLHGPRLILAEFGAGVLLPGLLGLAGLLRSGWRAPLGWYLLGLSANYLPLLAYAARIARAGGAEREAGDVAADRAELRRHARWQFWLLVPLAVACAAAWQEARRLRRPLP